jgi:putative phage-type endonuclease
MEQRTEEWYSARAGKVTASRVADVIARTKSGYGASRAAYMAELVIERITGKPTEKFSSAAMQWGTEKEPEALSLYQVETGALVELVGFVPHPDIEGSGASPDGLIGGDGLIEIKSPNSSTHLDTLLLQKIPDRYQVQMLWQMACTGRMWCDFVSFDPRMPDHLKLFVRRFNRDDVRIKELETEVKVFIAEINQKVDDLNKLYRKD